MTSTAEQRLQAIMSSPSYLLAEKDIDLLHRDELRPVRLQLELLKAELGLKRHFIKSTVVVFGGTQVVESEVAIKRLEQIEEHPVSKDEIWREALHRCLGEDALDLDSLAERQQRTLGGDSMPLGLGDFFFSPGVPLNPDNEDDDDEDELR